jgi:hypothetical protein
MYEPHKEDEVPVSTPVRERLMTLSSMHYCNRGKALMSAALQGTKTYAHRHDLVVKHHGQHA